MTRVLVAEYVCSTMNDRPEANSLRADSLWAEGWAMLSAAVADFLRIDGVEVRVPLARSFRETEAFHSVNWPAEVAVPVPQNREPTVFRELADWCDYALIIAPEFDGIL